MYNNKKCTPRKVCRKRCTSLLHETPQKVRQTFYHSLPLLWLFISCSIKIISHYFLFVNHMLIFSYISKKAWQMPRFFCVSYSAFAT